MIAITAIGVVSAVGQGRAAMAEALRAGKSGVRPVVGFPTEGLCSNLAAQAPVVTEADRALGLLKLATEDAVGGQEWAPSARRGVFLGSTKGSLAKVLDGSTDDPFGHLTAWLAQRVRARGPVRAIGAACASSSCAIGAALHAIDAGLIDEAIVAGVEALHPFVYSGFHALKAMSPAIIWRSSMFSKASFLFERRLLLRRDMAGFLIR